MATRKAVSLADIYCFFYLQLKLHESKLKHARLMGDRELESRVRMEKEAFLNTQEEGRDRERPPLVRDEERLELPVSPRL